MPGPPGIFRAGAPCDGGVPACVKVPSEKGPVSSALLTAGLRFEMGDVHRVASRRLSSAPPRARALQSHTNARATPVMPRSPRWAFVLRLGLGLVVLVTAGWLFGAIAEDVVNRDAPLSTLDIYVATWLHAHATPAVTRLMFWLSDMGAPLTVIVITLIVAAVLAWRRRWYRLAFLLLATVGGECVNYLIKVAVHRDRPLFEDPILTLTSFSFPSGHAMGSTLLYGALVAILIWPVPQWRWRIAALAAMAILVALICFSRIYLGVHYLSDVVAGCLAGVIWLVSCLMAVDALRYRRLRTN